MFLKDSIYSIRHLKNGKPSRLDLETQEPTLISGRYYLCSVSSFTTRQLNSQGKSRSPPWGASAGKRFHPLKKEVEKEKRERLSRRTNDVFKYGFT